MDVIFHWKSDQRIILIDVAYVPDLGFNLYSLHAVQRTHLIVSDASGTHIIRANLTFLRSSSRSYLRATRLPAGAVGARRRQGDIRATNLLRQLRHPIACECDLDLCHFDVDQAFVQSDLEDVFLRLPK